MVIESTTNYEQHKKEVHEVIMQKYGKARADKFLEFYSSRYDKWERSFIDYKLAFSLVDDYYKVRKFGTMCYGIVGTKGQGKSTLMKNILYFLYPEATHKNNITTKVDKLMNKLDALPVLNARVPIALDEPDDGHHFSSKEGKAIRNVVGKWRQQQIYFLICATDLNNIPTYIFRDLDVLIFTPHHGTAYAFRNKPKKKSYIVQDIKSWYNQRGKGYGVFFDIVKRKPKPAGYLKIGTHATSPLDLSEGDQYIADKAQDYKNDIQHAKELLRDKSAAPKEVKPSEREKIVLHMREQGKSMREIAKAIGVSHPTVVRICQKAVQVQARARLL